MSFFPNASIGVTGSVFPAYATLCGGSDGTDLRALLTDNTGQLKVLIENASAIAVSTTGQKNTTDANNTTTAILGIGGVFTGTATDVTNIATVEIGVYSDQNSALNGLSMQWSPDGTNWDYIVQLTYTAANGGLTLPQPVLSKYYRIVYTNGAVAQTVFRLYSLLIPVSVVEPTVNLKQAPTDSNLALLTRSVLVGKYATASTYLNIGCDSNGNLLVDQSFIANSAISISSPGIQKVGIVGGSGGAAIDAVQGAAAPANVLVEGGVYNTSLPTLTTGHASAIQLDSSGRQLVVDAAAETSLASLVTALSNPLPVSCTQTTSPWVISGAVTTSGTATVSGTVAFSNTTIAVTNAGTFAVQAVGTLTNNNAAPAATNIGALTALANAAAPTWTEGDQVLASVDLRGNQRVIVANAPQISNAGNPVLGSRATGSDAATNNVIYLTDTSNNYSLLSEASMRFNGSTWDRPRNNYNTTTGDVTTLTSAAGTYNGAAQVNYNARGAVITMLCGTVSGTLPTVVMQLQWSPDAGTTWLNYGAATSAISVATGNTVTVEVYPTVLTGMTFGSTGSVLISAPLPRTWRIVYTGGGTTYSIATTGVYVNYIL